MHMMRSTLPGLLLGATLVLGSCSAAADTGGGVASLSGEGGGAATTTTGPPTEEQVLTWVQCMRDQGLDIADPTVDRDGNLVIGGGPRGRAPGGATASGSTTTTTAANGSASAAPPDRAAFQKAQETCGQPPRTGGGFSEEDRQAMQDSQLKMAQCLRDQGLDVPDPDFSAEGPGGAPPAATDGGAAPAEQRRGGPFGDLDQDDPAVSAAIDTCRAELGDAAPGPGGRGRAGATATTAAP